MRGWGDLALKTEGSVGELLIPGVLGQGGFMKEWPKG